MDGNIFQEVDLLQVIRKVGAHNKRFQAKMLQRLEEHIDPRDPEFKELRKYFLDESNNLTRAIVREIFGDIEFMIR